MATTTRNRGWTRPARGDRARIEESVGIPLDDIDADVQEIDDRLTTAERQTTVTPVTIVGSGGSAPALRAGWARGVEGTPSLRFWKEGTRVHLAGMIVGSAGTGATVFVLPVGYQPARQAHFPLANTASGSGTSPLFVVSEDGQVRPVGPGTGIFWFDAISFDIER